MKGELGSARTGLAQNLCKLSERSTCSSSKSTTNNNGAVIVPRDRSFSVASNINKHLRRCGKYAAAKQGVAKDKPDAGGQSSPGIISQHCAAARCESARLKEWEVRCCQGGHPV